MPPVWTQNYNPLGNAVLSTLVAALPVTTLFYLLAFRRIAAWKAAVYSAIVGVLTAWLVFGMPLPMVGGALAHGAVYGIVRIVWVLINAVFVYEITVASGHFETIKQSIGGITDDRRLQVLLIAYAFGAVLEGAGGGGAPVAVCGAMLVGLGFKAMDAAVICLIANTAPVAFGGMGNPVRTLVAVTGLSEADLSATMGRILPWTAAILPFWLVRIQVPTSLTLQVWPGLAACGIGFALIQFFWSNYMDASLVDIMGGMGTLIWLAIFFKIWKPAQTWRYPNEPAATKYEKLGVGKVLHAWSPFLILAVLVVLWGVPFIKGPVEATSFIIPVPGLHNLVQRVAPVVPTPRLEGALFDFAWLGSVGTPTLFAGLIAAPILGLSFRRTMQIYFETWAKMKYSVIAILAMLALGFLTRYSGMDAILGLAMANTGVLFPIFGTLIGWLGVALSGTDAGSNALFGSLQVITANKLGLSPVLMASANSAGGVMGKMMAAQSLIVACAATGMKNKEGDLFRALFKHSVALAILLGLIVTAFAYVVPNWVAEGHHFR